MLEEIVARIYEEIKEYGWDAPTLQLIQLFTPFLVVAGFLCGLFSKRL